MMDKERKYYLEYLDYCKDNKIKNYLTFKEYRKPVIFHKYLVYRWGEVQNKKGKTLSTNERKRRGGGVDKRVTLYINKKARHFTLQRLIASCFFGPIFGYEINHKDRDTTNNHFINLERVTASENQQHWRNCDLTK